MVDAVERRLDLLDVPAEQAWYRRIDAHPGDDGLIELINAALLSMVEVVDPTEPPERPRQGLRFVVVGEKGVVPSVALLWREILDHEMLRRVYGAYDFGRGWVVVRADHLADPALVTDGVDALGVLAVVSAHSGSHRGASHVREVAEGLVELLLVDAPPETERALEGFLAEHPGDVSLRVIEDGTTLLAERARLEAAVRRVQLLRGEKPERPPPQTFLALASAWCRRADHGDDPRVASWRVARDAISGVADEQIANLIRTRAASSRIQLVRDDAWPAQVLAEIGVLAERVLAEDDVDARVVADVERVLDGAVAKDLAEIVRQGGGGEAVIREIEVRRSVLERLRASCRSEPPPSLDPSGPAADELCAAHARARSALAGLPPEPGPRWLTSALLVASMLLVPPLWDLGATLGLPTSTAPASWTDQVLRGVAVALRPPVVLLVSLGLVMLGHGVWQMWTRRRWREVRARHFGPLGALAASVSDAALAVGGPRDLGWRRLDAALDERLGRALRIYGSRLDRLASNAGYACRCLDALEGELAHRLAEFPDPEHDGWTVARYPGSFVRWSIVRPPPEQPLIAEAVEPLRPAWGDDLVLTDREEIEDRLLWDEAFAAAVEPISQVLVAPWDPQVPLALDPPEMPICPADVEHRRLHVVGRSLANQLEHERGAAGTAWWSPAQPADRDGVAWTLDVLVRRRGATPAGGAR